MLYSGIAVAVMIQGQLRLIKKVLRALKSAHCGFEKHSSVCELPSLQSSKTGGQTVHNSGGRERRA